MPRPGSTAGHGCGHHLFGAASAAACLALAEQIKAGTLKGTLRFYGCPAEEGAAPRRSWSAPTCSTTATPCCTGTRRARTRPATSPARRGSPPSSGSTGRARTPPAAPEAGRSALDAVELTNHAAELLREHTPDFTRIHHVITAGGEAPNVVPDFAEVSYYIRHPQGRGRARALYARLVKCAEAGALATETRLETQYLGGIVEIVPNQALGRVARMNLERLNDLSYDAHEAEFAGRDPQDAGRDAPAAAAGEPVARGRSHRAASARARPTWATSRGSCRRPGSRRPAGCRAPRRTRGRRSRPEARPSAARG